MPVVSIKSITTAWPYIRQFLFREQPVKEALKAHWHSWFILVMQSIIFILFFFMYEQAILQSKQQASIQLENVNLKEHILQIMPADIGDVEKGSEVAARIISLENDVSYYKDLYAQTYRELELHKAKQRLDDIERKYESTKIDTKKSEDPHQTRAKSFQRKLEGLSEIH